MEAQWGRHGGTFIEVPWKHREKPMEVHEGTTQVPHGSNGSVHYHGSPMEAYIHGKTMGTP